MCSGPPDAMLARMELGTVLSVWAHPDDETYLCGGLMARAVQAGSRVVCVTATRGEQGSTDPDRYPPGPSLARLRTIELERALAELGVHEHRWLDYPDGGCADVEAEEAVGRLRDIVADVRPNTVLTFGPDGITGHDDHRTVSRWVTEATADTGARVHYATYTPQWLERYRAVLDDIGALMDGEPPCTPLHELSMHVLLDGEALEVKWRAILSQPSQVIPTVDAVGEEVFRYALAEEAFRLLRSPA